MLTFVEDRKQIKIFISPDAKKVVEAFASQFDMKEIGVASRIYSWFGTLPLPVQKWITGLTDGSEGEGMKEFARMLMEGRRPAPPGEINYDPEPGVIRPPQVAAAQSEQRRRRK